MPDDKKPAVENPPHTNELRDALAELVACKDLEVATVVEWGHAWNHARAALSSAVPGDRDE
jgi:hypothetical protein